MKHVHDDEGRRARDWLLARGAQLRDRLARVQADLRRETNPLPRDSADAAIVVENDEILAALEQATRRELALIDSAMQRLEQGLHSICETCGGKIEADRLRIVPFASQCVTCAGEK
jgi:DnaK suppressor protein